MRLGRLFGIPIRINPLLLPIAAIAVWMGEGLMFIVMTASVALHELTHLLAARFVRVRVIELELMPFGGAARMDALWMVRPAQVFVVWRGLRAICSSTCARPRSF